MKRPRTPSTLCSLLVLLPVVSASFDCHLSLSSASFDLTPLSGTHSFSTSTPTPPTITKTSYSLSLCSPLPLAAPSDDLCPEGTYVCQTTLTTREGLEDRIVSVVPLAGEIGEGELQPRAEAVEGKSVAERWTLGLQGGMYNGVKQSVEIEMVCDQTAKEGNRKTVPSVVEYDPKAGHLKLSWTTSAACSTSGGGGGDDTPPPSNPDEGKDKEGDKEPESPPPTREGGKGFFGWFFTLLFFGLLIYFAGGAYYNYTTYGSTGWDMVPHRDVWRDLPYVVNDLVKGRGGSRNGYSALG
ncbi:hypothetical protein MNV49_006130 [Pseudohyphozyma bogoriensis]|nr:hypothetical protein MNV49_006130 [Pseudohyphozyma bogoriensis]